MTLPANIIILGSAKSGTTALFYAVRKALVEGCGVSTRGLFEPSDPSMIADYLNEKRDPVPLVKVLLAPLLRKNEKIIGRFDKKIIIFRDPRDNVVSRIVFMLNNLVRLSEKEKIEALVELFRKKERSPDTVSVVDMITQVGRIAGRADLLRIMRESAVLPARFKRERSDEFFLMPYDDMVHGRFDALNNYLGILVRPDFAVDKRHSYVTRTKGSGDWRNWFLEQDVQYFARDVADDLRILGFDPLEAPNVSKSINPATCSVYVEAQFARMAEKRRTRRMASKEARARKHKKQEQLAGPD